MNLWFRLLATIFSTFWKPRLKPPLGRSTLRFRVWPNDLDTNFHMNNGRYLTVMDLGRPDLILRMGILRPMLKYGWMPVLTSNIIRFRRELRLFEPFELESAIRYWQNTTFVMEHRIRFVKGRRAGGIAATALVKGGFYDRRERKFITMDRLFDELGLSKIDSPQLTPEIAALLTAEDAIRSHDQADDPAAV